MALYVLILLPGLSISIELPIRLLTFSIIPLRLGDRGISLFFPIYPLPCYSTPVEDSGLLDC